ncbi:MAG: hypothetical protein RQ715_01215 [Methylococcales bacterium]|nr:hypothetical protein [Methylococcales bacterium]
MKKMIIVVMGVVVALGSTMAMAQSKVEKSVILNSSKNAGNANIAIGRDNVASTGSVNIKNSKVDKSVILNSSKNAGNANIAIGEGNTSTTGSVTIE